MDLRSLFKRYRWWLVLAVALALPAAGDAFTLTFTPIGYSGRLLDANGPVADGPYDMTFRIFDASTAGVELYEQAIAGVPVTDGYFNVFLGIDTDPTTTATVIDDAIDPPGGRFLEITVGTDTLAPRQILTATPWALFVTP